MGRSVIVSKLNDQAGKVHGRLDSPQTEHKKPVKRKLAQTIAQEAPNDQANEDGAPPSTSMRQPRKSLRRLDMISKQKAKIQKTLGVPVDSDEKATKVQTLLDEWVRRFDKNVEQRDARRETRKRKEAARQLKKDRKRAKALGEASESASSN